MDSKNALALASVFIITKFSIFSLATLDKTQCNVGEFERMLKAFEIIPDLLQSVPKQCLHVEYDGKPVMPGDAVDYLETLAPPSNISWDHEDGSFYSLVMTGLDVPTRDQPNERESQHWVVGNIPGTNISAGEQIFPFEPAGMHYDMGVHRIAFVVFKQNSKIQFDEMLLGERRESVSRAYYSTQEFAKKYNFGPPIAANFYEFDFEV